MRHPGDNNPKKDGNRKFIDRHPAKQQSSGLPRTGIDRSGYGTGDAAVDARGMTEWQIAHSEQVLVYHEQENGQQQAGPDWMSQLKQNSMQFLADQRGVQLQEVYKESVYKTGIAILIDKIYGLLQRYTFEFNQVAGGTDLHVSGTISGDVTEVTRYNRMREVQETATYFRCRFSTKFFALTVRGSDDTVEAYILPVNKVMALSQTENQYPALCTIQVKISEHGMMWRMRDGEPAVDTLDQLCMWLFTKLVEETKVCVDKQLKPPGT
ncbi:MAG: hypothetical protein K2X93_09975 [Candidatus Obscuribacterales bacterium]|nr:hypothetical protein [Candidatus Obscuribacterales bacterium]